MYWKSGKMQIHLSSLFQIISLDIHKDGEQFVAATGMFVNPLKRKVEWLKKKSFCIWTFHIIPLTLKFTNSDHMGVMGSAEVLSISLMG